MIRWLRFQSGGSSATAGLLNGAGSYTWLPFDCRLGRIAGLAAATGSGAGGAATVQARKGSTAVGSAMNFGQSVAIYEPDLTTVFPALTTGNIDGDGRGGFDAIVDATFGDYINLGVELVPVDPTFGTSEIWNLSATGEPAHGYGYLYKTGDDTAGMNPTDTLRFSNLYNSYGQPAIVVLPGEPPDIGPFNNQTGGSEDGGDVAPDETIRFWAGVGTPLARAGRFSHFRVISSEAGGFDGDYRFTLRKNKTDVLEVNPTSGGARIFTDTGQVFFQRGDQWSFSADGTGVRVLGALQVVFTPDTDASQGAGYGHQGYGGRGYGG